MAADIKGWDQLERFFARATGIATDGAEAGLSIEANEMMTEAKAQTPVDTGTMRASGTVFPPEREGETVSVELGFGGASAPYVIVQHEGVHLHHPTGNAKFLERPVLAGASRLSATVAREVARALGRLGR